MSEREARTTPNLFQLGKFILHSNATSAWKIDCDALTDADIAAVAAMFSEILPPFGSVEGVPRGGLRLAKALEPFVTTGRVLIVDDVLTTGRSMEDQRAGRDAIGAVIFARNVCRPWIVPLFIMGQGAAKTGNPT